MCGCGKSKTSTAPGTYTVYYSAESEKAPASFRTHVEALAEAARNPGASVLPGG